MRSIPSKHAGSDSHPVRIRWEALARSGPDDSCTPACFRTGSVWPKPDNLPELNRIRVGFAQYYPGRLLMNGTESKSRKLVAGRMRHARNQPLKWFLHTSLLLDQMRLARGPYLRQHPRLFPQRTQRCTGGDVRSLVGCHPKETLHCCRVTSVVFICACSDSAYAGHPYPLLTTMLLKSDWLSIPSREQTATASLHQSIYVNVLVLNALIRTASGCVVPATPLGPCSTPSSG